MPPLAAPPEGVEPPVLIPLEEPPDGAPPDEPPTELPPDASEPPVVPAAPPPDGSPELDEQAIPVTLARQSAKVLLLNWLNAGDMVFSSADMTQCPRPLQSVASTVTLGNFVAQKRRCANHPRQSARSLNWSTTRPFTSLK
jgi:hypothetical protein